MNASEAHNGRDSATTFRDQWPPGETDVIARETALAKAALSESIAELKDSLRTAGDVRLWTQYHPWISVGLAATAGFVAARSVFSGADGAGADHVAAGASAGRPLRAPETPSRETGGSSRSPWAGFLFDLAKDGLAVLAANAFHGHSAPPAPSSAAQERPAAPAT